MKVIKNERNYIIIENDNFIYLISYNSVIGKIDQCNNLYLTNEWDYSQTTLQHLYSFIRNYCMQKDNNGDIIKYKLDEVSNKREYIQKLIDNKTIKLLSEVVTNA